MSEQHQKMNFQKDNHHRHREKSKRSDSRHYRYLNYHKHPERSSVRHSRTFIRSSSNSSDLDVSSGSRYHDYDRENDHRRTSQISRGGHYSSRDDRTKRKEVKEREDLRCRSKNNKVIDRAHKYDHDSSSSKNDSSSDYINSSSSSNRENYRTLQVSVGKNRTNPSKKMFVDTVKNTNPEWHSLTKGSRKKRKALQQIESDDEEMAVATTGKRDRSTRRRKIVNCTELDDQVTDEFNQESERKRPRINMNDETSEINIRKKVAIVRNDNPECHSLNKAMKCQICNNFYTYTISHYVNAHPDHEVYPSRVAPDVGHFLRNSNVDHVCTRELLPTNVIGYKQSCYFCNKILAFSRTTWLTHFIRHTGYFEYRCRDCSKKSPDHGRHKCKEKRNIENIPQRMRTLKDDKLLAYLCDCNFIRFEKAEMEKHVRCEHAADTKTGFQEVIFLRFKESEKNERENLSRKENQVTAKQYELRTSTGTQFSENESKEFNESNESGTSWERCSTLSDDSDLMYTTKKLVTDTMPDKPRAKNTDDEEASNSDMTLCNSYKYKCTFITDNGVKMLIHLRSHEANPSNNSSPNWLRCVCCDAMYESALTLVTHISDQHQSSLFQCPHFIYQSCAAAYNFM